MGSHPRSKRYFSEAEYLAMERASDRKHEYHHGEIFAIPGASSRHNLVVAGFVRELGNALKGRRCRVYPSDLRVKTPGGLYTYPDVSALCGIPRFEDEEALDTLLNPEVLIEVLSDSTERYDRGDKFEMYRAIPSLRDYVLASQLAVQAEHFVRQPDGGWLLHVLGAGQALRFAAFDCAVGLDEVYAGALDTD